MFTSTWNGSPAVARWATKPIPQTAVDVLIAYDLDPGAGSVEDQPVVDRGFSSVRS